jgi:tripartite-type tricarboxylate transporter receptor subunit TctC
MKRMIYAAVASLVLAFPATVWPQYPLRPIRLVVPLPAGGNSDAAARILGGAMAERMGQPFVIENKPGADGLIAAEYVLRAAPDGYTLLWTSSGAMLGVPLLQKDPPYAPSSFSPVSLVGRIPLFLYVNPKVPARTVAELVEHARANPGKLTCATATFGDVVAISQFMRAGGITMTRVPYKGRSIPDLVAGHIDVAVAPASAMPFVRDGPLRVLGVFLPHRADAAPDVPTMLEAGIQAIAVPSVVGIVGPPRLPSDIADRLAEEIRLALARPEIRHQLGKQLFQTETSTAQAFSDALNQEFQAAQQLVRELRITQD